MTLGKPTVRLNKPTENLMVQIPSVCPLIGGKFDEISDVYHSIMKRRASK